MDIKIIASIRQRSDKEESAAERKKSQKVVNSHDRQYPEETEARAREKERERVKRWGSVK